MQGVVMGVGPGARDENGERVAPTVQAGDKVAVRQVVGHRSHPGWR